MADFTEAVKSVVRTIPKGKVMTYKEVAAAAGKPPTARAAANIMAKNYDKDVPCHRVVRADGTLGGYNRGGTASKKALLEKEGVIIDGNVVRV